MSVNAAPLSASAGVSSDLPRRSTVSISRRSSSSLGTSPLEPLQRSLGWHTALVAVPIIVFVAHASVFGSWIVDDAAISWAYARSLATGHGLVAQPGVAPVEGYSNPL